MPPLFPTLRFLNHRHTPADGAWNMACDEAILRNLETGDPPVLRVYAWDRPTLSFGYFLKYADAVAAAGPEEEVIRRWTGGGLVHHGQDLTWSLIVPGTHPFARVRPADSYGQLHKAVAEALTAFGINDALVVPADAPAPRGGLCFEAPAPGDLLLHGRKIAGAGQRRTRKGLLHQASLSLSERELPDHFAETLSRQLGKETIPYELPPYLELPRGKYAEPAWNLRI